MNAVLESTSQSVLRNKQCTPITQYPSPITYNSPTYTVNMVLTWLAPDLLLFHCRAEVADKEEQFEDSMVCVWGKKTEVRLWGRTCVLHSAKLTGDILKPWFPGPLGETFMDPDSWALLSTRSSSCNLKNSCYRRVVNKELDTIQLLKWKMQEKPTGCHFV